MNKIGICGAGLIGASWAIGFANSGYMSYVYDSNPNSVENFNKYFDDLLQDLYIIDPNINDLKIILANKTTEMLHGILSNKKMQKQEQMQWVLIKFPNLSLK